MLQQLIAFGICFALGAGFRLLWIAVCLLAKYLKIVAVSIVFDVVFVAICAVLATVFMIYYSGAVTFYQYGALVLGIALCSVFLLPNSKKAELVAKSDSI